MVFSSQTDLRMFNTDRLSDTFVFRNNAGVVYLISISDTCNGICIAFVLGHHNYLEEKVKGKKVLILLHTMYRINKL